MRISDGPPENGGKRSETASSALSSTVLLYWLLGLTVLLLVSGYLSDRESRLVPFLIVLPAFVAGVGTVRQTFLTAGWVVLVVTGSVLYHPLQPAVNLSLIAFSVVLGGLSVAGGRWRIRKNEEIARLRSASAALQRQILRPLPLLTDQLLVDGLYEPAEEDSMVGGDVYEVVASPYGSRVLIADVQGKGLPAIGTAFAVLGAFREAAFREPALPTVVNALENAVLRHNAFAKQAGEPERFVTALVLSVDSGYQAQAVNCGHVPLYILSGERTGPVLFRDPGAPLGLGSLTSQPRAVEWFDFPPGSTLLLCTDGVTEARDPSGVFYPLEDRLARWHDASPDQVVSTLHTELLRHTRGNLRDDVAVLAIRRNSPGTTTTTH
ncbi:PP2C family protein-serine/threonine phosphatase [Streptosporangium sp. CA-115845]|uniref:PP2C family protein-serine/threonine phosphatase n=1 Tax=Streptosporangium sp. CA-115845 TaxID=3240071 RepID=UPI003D8D836E